MKILLCFFISTFAAVANGAIGAFPFGPPAGMVPLGGGPPSFKAGMIPPFAKGPPPGIITKAPFNWMAFAAAKPMGPMGGPGIAGGPPGGAPAPFNWMQFAAMKGPPAGIVTKAPFPWQQFAAAKVPPAGAMGEEVAEPAAPAPFNWMQFAAMKPMGPPPGIVTKPPFPWEKFAAAKVAAIPEEPPMENDSSPAGSDEQQEGPPQYAQIARAVAVAQIARGGQKDDAADDKTDDNEQPSLPPMPMPAMPFPAYPFGFNPFFGFKMQKMMFEQMYNITTTPKPPKIKLKIKMPYSAAAAAGMPPSFGNFPPGSYEMS